MLLLLFNIENWTRYGDSETYIDIEVDDLHIMDLSIQVQTKKYSID